MDYNQQPSIIKKMLLPIGIIAIVIGAVLGGVYLSKQEPVQGAVLGSGIDQAEHRAGNPEAKVQLIEYADFQCPACASFDPLIKRLMEENGSWINFAYRHFPLKEIHKNATEAAYAAEAAGNQGKFWEMKETIYTRQAEWSAMPDPAPKFLEFATGLELDENKFLQDMDSEGVQIKVDSDYRTGLAAGFNSTPTFVVNGQKITNPQSYEQLVELLQQKLNQ